MTAHDLEITGGYDHRWHGRASAPRRSGGGSGPTVDAEPKADPEAAAKPNEKKPNKKKPTAQAAGDDKPKAETPTAPPKPAKSQADKANGRALYMAKCKACRGGDGRGDTAFGRKIGVISRPVLGKSKILSAVVSGVPGTKMKSYKKKLTDKEIDDVVAFVRGL